MFGERTRRYSISFRATPWAAEMESKMAMVVNVDLDVIAKRSLEPLVAAFGKRVDVLYVGRRGRKYSAHFEVVRTRGLRKRRLSIPAMRHMPEPRSRSDAGGAGQ